MNEKRFFVKKIEDDFCILDSSNDKNVVIYCDSERVIQQCCDLLNEQEQKIQRWKNLYELKDAEVTARVDGLNKVCNYYLNEVLFKADTDPNEAVREVINEILNTEVEM